MGRRRSISRATDIENFKLKHLTRRVEMLTEKQKSEIETKVIEWTLKATEKLGRDFPLASVVYDLTGVVAGAVIKYPGGEFVIRINQQIAEHNWEAYLKRTIPHEVAHIIAWIIDPLRGKGHGSTWKRVMSEIFGLSTSRCHQYDISMVRSRGYSGITYKCNCSEHVVSNRKHNNIQKKGMKYICKRCKTVLVFSHWVVFIVE